MKWPQLTLEHLAAKEKASIKIGPFGSQLKKSELTSSGIHVLGIENILNNKFDELGDRYITEEKFQTLRTVEVRHGDILITMMGTIGAVAIVPEGVSTSIMDSHLLRFRPNYELTSSEYVSWLIKGSSATRAAINGRAHGAIMKGLNSSIIKSLPAPLPSPSEQRRIVEILDQADRLRKLRAEADKKAARILPALFIKMFGDPATNPMGWPEKPLGETLKKKKGALQSGPFGTHLHNYDFVENGTVLAVGIDNVHDTGFEFGRERRITQGKYIELEKYTLVPGDILITIMGTIGRTCVFPEWAGRAICTKHVYRIQVNPSIFHPEYVTASIRFSQYVRSQLGTSVTGQIVSGITSKALRALSVYTPPIKMQERFAEIKLAVDKNTKIKQQSKSKVDTLFSIILHRAFNGDLTASWRQAHMKELLQEMEMQAKALR